MKINPLTDWEIAINNSQSTKDLQDLINNLENHHWKIMKGFIEGIKKSKNIKDMNPIFLERYENLMANDMDNGHDKKTYEEIKNMARKRINEIKNNQIADCGADQSKIKKIILQASEKYQIVAEAYDDGIFADMNVYLNNNKGETIQELVSIRHPYNIISNGDEDFVEKIKDKIQVLVWANCDNEDFTNTHDINIYTEERS